MTKQNKQEVRSKISQGAFFIAFGLLAFAFPVQADDTYEEGDTYINIYEDTVWHKNDNLNFSKRVNIDQETTLTIEKGARITFDKDINGNGTYLDVGGGRLVADGTQEEPIIITSNSDSSDRLIRFNGEHWSTISELPPSFLRYVDIFGGGNKWDNNHNCPECEAFWNKFIPKAYAETEGVGAFYFQGGRVHLENCTFHGNIYADIEVDYNEKDSMVGTNNYLEIVNSNFEKNDDSAAINAKVICDSGGYDCKNKIFLKDNWYGSAQGPHIANENENLDGKGILGYALVDGWRTNNTIVDPVVIIPGIMGSAYKYAGGIGGLVLDPILFTYDNLMLSFDKNGYEKNKNLFGLPYEWRNSNVVTVNLLSSKIEDIKNNTKISKVDIVAHSMGGLVARQYIESADYQNDIDQLVTLGTPHKGSPESYLTWEAGEVGVNFEDVIMRKLFYLEARHQEYDSLRRYINEKVISVGELLPDYNYLYDTEKSKMREYYEGYPRNIFLENLNNQTGLNNLKKVNLINIYGKVSGESTMKKFRVGKGEVFGDWQHGMPENFNDASTDRGIEYGEGDETVPLASVTGIEANKNIEINSTHGDLPTKAQCDVIKELTGKAECKYVNDIDRVKNVVTFGVFSPVDIQVVAPDGKWAGKNFSGLDESKKIKDAYYTGYETENEFITIPNPQDGEYKILTQGTGDGEYKIEASKISQDEVTNEAKESTAEIKGTSQLDQQEEKKVELSQDEVVVPQEDSIAPEIFITSPENKTYLNNQVMDISYQVSDNLSPEDKIQKTAYYDNAAFDKTQIDLPLEHLGQHKFKVEAKDEANNANQKEVSFENTTDINTMISNLRHYANLKLIDKRVTQKILEMKLKEIKLIVSLIFELNNNHWLPQKTKNALIKSLKKAANDNVNMLITIIQKSPKEKIDLKLKDILLENLNYVKIK